MFLFFPRIAKGILQPELRIPLKWFSMRATFDAEAPGGLRILTADSLLKRKLRGLVHENGTPHILSRHIETIQVGQFSDM